MPPPPVVEVEGATVGAADVVDCVGVTALVVVPPLSAD